MGLDQASGLAGGHDFFSTDNMSLKTELFLEDRIRKRVLHPLRCDLFLPILILRGSGSLNPLFGTNLCLSARLLSQTGNFFALEVDLFRRTAS